MPKLPRNVRRHGARYVFRAQFNGRPFVRDLGTNEREMRRLAKIAANDLKAKRFRSEDVKPDTVKGFSHRWLSVWVAQHRNEKNQRLARQRLKDHVLPVIGRIYMDEVRRGHLEELRASLEAKGLSVNTVRHILSDARSMFAYAVRMELQNATPFAGGGILPKSPRRAPDRLSDDEVAKILANCPKKGSPAVRLSLLTGLRWGEIQRLQWRHIDLGNRVLWVDQSKSGRPRQVPLTEDAVDLLRKERAKTSSIFVISWRPTQADSLVRTVRKRTGVKWNFHKLRHTFACRYLKQGGSKGALQRILGHSSVTTTEIYGELSDDAVKAEFSSVRVALP